mmetsp:Transcript_4365/g.7682  ORF Transcript_4365/g.7682 Transcript_4365/m.7682 type:complete len:183 (-) Transcript_4365:57-605(-)|eukprot:CAMPEP_0184509240 /NCGR_PEP_ID=MMETSP0198_2-20121128/1181_1 /TAXON_ID=1112570 /ORGANISM="Thraustochytrium sp., Strain LLF1b" /LENGTH=182 /DNA_ID=CAMNT_0026899063 /DNA_START=852 /DNA_END=1400 /DNA_ORIENTATION=-
MEGITGSFRESKLARGIGGGRLNKVAFLGSSCSGKSSLVLRLAGCPVQDEYRETLGVDITVIENVGEDVDVKQLELWCFSGGQRYLPVTQQNLPGCDVAVLVYDAGSPESLEKCLFWRNEVLRLCPSSRLLLVGNKVDLGDQSKSTVEISAEQAEAWGLQHFRVSSKTGAGIEEFQAVLASS